MDEALRKKYIPMTETTYYTLLSVMVPRHGYAIMQYVSELTKGRIVLGTGTLYTMVGRLAADGVIVTVPESDKKSYLITETGLELVREETGRLGRQLSDGKSVLGSKMEADMLLDMDIMPCFGMGADFQNGGGISEKDGDSSDGMQEDGRHGNE